MAESRPFAMLEDLYRKADNIWSALSPADWLEAFAEHQKTASKKSDPVQKSLAASWSGGDQLGAAAAENGVHEQLADANRLYEEKFGFIFIVCPVGKTADEVVASCRERFGNSVETEIGIAAEETRKITEVRLNKLLEQ